MPKRGIKTSEVTLARTDPELVRRLLEFEPHFQRPQGDALLHVFADCVEAAHRVGPTKWSVNIDWRQGGNSTGLFALNFGKDYLCFHRDRSGFILCLDEAALPADLSEEWGLPDREPVYRGLPTSRYIQLEPEAQEWPLLRAAYLSMCELETAKWKVLHGLSKGPHSPALLEYLRRRLNRPAIPDPTW